MSDADLEPIFAALEARGHDMSKMRAAAASVAALEVGVDTPAPGTLMRQALADTTVLTLEPLHNGLNEPPEGKFFKRDSGLIVPFSINPAPPRYVTRLNKRVRRLFNWLTGLTMCFVSLIVVLVKAW